MSKIKFDFKHNSVLEKNKFNFYKFNYNVCTFVKFPQKTMFSCECKTLDESDVKRDFAVSVQNLLNNFYQIMTKNYEIYYM